MKRLAYLGPALAGRDTALVSVLKAAGREDRGPSRLDRASNEFTLFGHDFSAFVSRIRAWLFYEDPRSPELDSRIAEEIEWLALCDGLVFVLDAQSPRLEANLHQWEQLQRDLASRGTSADDKCVVFQLNKMDLVDLVSLDWVRGAMSSKRCAYVESVATRGEGCVEAIEAMVRLLAQSS